MRKRVSVCAGDAAVRSRCVFSHCTRLCCKRYRVACVVFNLQLSGVAHRTYQRWCRCRVTGAGVRARRRRGRANARLCATTTTTLAERRRRWRRRPVVRQAQRCGDAWRGQSVAGKASAVIL
jgi:hypothetical protein